MHQRAQALQVRLPRVLQDVAQHRAGLLPLVALQAEQDRRLVGEVLVQRADADTGAFGHPRGGEPRGTFVLQNLSSGFEDGRDQVIRT
ncbi:hypothetical protein D3C73_1310660 [compost metagenome]